MTPFHPSQSHKAANTILFLSLSARFFPFSLSLSLNRFPTNAHTTHLTHFLLLLPHFTHTFSTLLRSLSLPLWTFPSFSFSLQHLASLNALITLSLSQFFSLIFYNGKETGFLLCTQRRSSSRPLTFSLPVHQPFPNRFTYDRSIHQKEKQSKPQPRLFTCKIRRFKTVRRDANAVNWRTRFRKRGSKTNRVGFRKLDEGSAITCSFCFV